MDYHGEPLRDDQTRHPVLWHATLKDLGYADMVDLPELDDDWFQETVWRDGKTTKRFKSFGHQTKERTGAPHFVCTRVGTPMHTDPGFARYALQLQLCNPAGFAVVGLDDDVKDMPLFHPGLVILLDTWSPHQVLRDPRLPKLGLSKLLAGVDYVDKPVLDRELPRILSYIPLLEDVCRALAK